VLSAAGCVALQRVLQLVSLLFASSEFEELEIVVLLHELAVLRRQSAGPRFGQPIARRVKSV